MPHPCGVCYLVYTPDAKSIHLECTRRMNEEMYKILKQKQDNYDSLLSTNDPSRSGVELVLQPANQTAWKNEMNELFSNCMINTEL
ncbi:hypothetical protein CEXT_278611 [Caerostris extrusa]|uniref:Uncharacterized protein n=1 Tax=Caerostris extrusa TaxID=172846 RepID=A0AAV4XNV9_CAEEX|nr:hypothetical protein CEXT_278611 [Caerostris extrusa]